VYLLVVKKVWRNEDLPYYLIFLGSMAVGLLLGFFVAKHLNEKHFQVLLLFLILVSGGVFVSSDMNPVILQTLVTLICIFVGIAFGLILLWNTPQVLYLRGTLSRMITADSAEKLLLKRVESELSPRSSLICLEG